MRRAACLFGLIGLVLVFICAPQALAQTGDVQITAAPRLRVYVDGRFVGITTAQEDGKYLRNLSVGRHTIRVEKRGFAPKSFAVTVRPGTPVEIRVGQLKPSPRFEDRGRPGRAVVRQKVGTVVIRSIPLRCTIHFLGQVKNKTSAEVVVRNVPVGRHQIKFKRGGTELSANVTVGDGENWIVSADFLRGRVGKRKTLAKTITNSIGMKFVLIPAGSFMMGSPAGELKRDNDEGPQHRVVISRPFYMQTTEVTQVQYRKIMGTNPSHFKGCDRCPVELVSWNDAQEFIRRLNAREKTNKYRLPTEAEWEYACRAGTTTPFFFGRTISTDQANYDGRYVYGSGRKDVYRKKTTPVGSFPPNRWGLYDMHGNVWEWCSDWYGKTYYRNSPGRDPKGPSSGRHRVLRSGSWYSCPRRLRSADRYWTPPASRNRNHGFRVARNL